MYSKQYGPHGLKQILPKFKEYENRGYYKICVNDWPDKVYKHLLPQQLQSEEAFWKALEDFNDKCEEIEQHPEQFSKDEIDAYTDWGFGRLELVAIEMTQRAWSPTLIVEVW